MKVSVTFTNANPNSIYNKLAARLGREPADAEVRSELRRIRDSVLVELAAKGKLRHQRQ